MINFSSHNIQTTHRSGYMPTVVNNNNAGSSIKDTKEIPPKIYSYATTLKSPGLKYFVSNIAYNAQFDKESDVSKKSTLQSIGCIHSFWYTAPTPHGSLASSLI